MTLDANTYLKENAAPPRVVDVVTVADVDDEDLVGNSLLHIWELRLGNRAKLWFRL